MYGKAKEAISLRSHKVRELIFFHIVPFIAHVCVCIIPPAFCVTNQRRLTLYCSTAPAWFVRVTHKETADRGSYYSTSSIRKRLLPTGACKKQKREKGVSLLLSINTFISLLLGVWAALPNKQTNAPLPTESQEPLKVERLFLSVLAEREATERERERERERQREEAKREGREWLAALGCWYNPTYWVFASIDSFRRK